VRTAAILCIKRVAVVNGTVSCGAAWIADGLGRSAWPCLMSPASVELTAVCSGGTIEVLPSAGTNMRKILSFRSDLQFEAEQVDAMANAFSAALNALGEPARTPAAREIVSSAHSDQTRRPRAVRAPECMSDLA
jgi:hypothetical protein